MRHIIIVGSSGFLGSRIVAELLSRGHRITCAGRDPATLRRRFPSCRAAQLELSRMTIAHWVSELAGVDAVVNAAGVLGGDLTRVHAAGPIVLFDASAEAKVGSALQISALGAGVQTTTFLSTKAKADRHLLRLAAEAGLEDWHGCLRPLRGLRQTRRRRSYATTWQVYHLRGGAGLG